MLVVVRDLIPGLFLPCIVSLQCFVKQLVINLLQILIDKYTTKHIYEKELQTAEDQFDMNGFYGSDYYVKSGSGTICLSQTGKVNDVKLSFKYGHNQFGPAVSVSYPWGVSFGLDGAETIFQPDEIVYNDFATVK